LSSDSTCFLRLILFLLVSKQIGQVPVFGFAQRSSNFRLSCLTQRVYWFGVFGLGFPIGPGDWVSTPVFDLRVQGSAFHVRSWSRSDFTTESTNLGLFSGLISDLFAALFLRFSSECAECKANVSFLHFPNEDSFRCQQCCWSGSLLVRQGAAS
jgi:hypothetical protein